MCGANCLLDAAIQLLETTPIEELSFKQVSEKAGVPEGSAYHFFANRYDLLAALASQLAQGFADAYSQPIARENVHNWHDLADLIVDRAVERCTAAVTRPRRFGWAGARLPRCDWLIT